MNEISFKQLQERQTLLIGFLGILNGIAKTQGDTVWVSEHETAHEALVGLAEEWHPAFAEWLRQSLTNQERGIDGQTENT